MTKSKKIRIYIFILVIATVAISASYLYNNLGKGEYYKNPITDDELEKALTKKESKLIMFHKESCPECMNIGVFTESISKDVNLETYDTSTNNFELFNITVVPTVIHYENGIEKNRIQGIISKNDLKRFIKSIKDENIKKPNR